MREVVDQLIEERAPWLRRGGPGVALGAAAAAPRAAVRAHHQDRRGAGADARPRECMQSLSDMIAQHVEVSGLENIPRHGPAMVVCNHPTGIADGIVLFGALAKVRPDLFIFANADAIRVLPQLDEVIAPVEWRPERRTHKQNRETMDYARSAFAAGRLAVLFPSGRLAKRRWWRLNERPWMASGAMMARKFNLPVVPLHITARNSALFYLFDRIHPTLRDITLFHEVLNKTRQPYRLTLGPVDRARRAAARLGRGDRGAARPHARARRRQAADRADRPGLRPPARPEAGPADGVTRFRPNSPSATLGIVEGANAMRPISIAARPQPLEIDLDRTALLVVDMQNDFGADGGMFDRAGIDIAAIKAIVPNIAALLADARAAGIPIVYLKMQFAPDLGDAGGDRLSQPAEARAASAGRRPSRPRPARAGSWSATPGTPRSSRRSNRCPGTSS